MNTQFSLDTKIKVGIIGFGRMGRFYWEAMRKSGRWEIAYICDTDPTTRELAKKLSPESRVIDNDQRIFEDESIQVVGLFTLADSRLEQIEKAIRYGKHIIAEKPVADTMEKEWKVVDMIENSNVLSTVNLYLRNSWYHNLMKEYIQKGEIGELAIIRICHMTPGLAPGEGHEYEGPAFHDCGMHYVDIVRWYAESEYRTWNAQGVNMWNYKDPWWVQCHGTFQNGIVFDITQGFVYGQLSKDQTHNSYVDIIGTEGIVRMTHDFKTALRLGGNTFPGRRFALGHFVPRLRLGLVGGRLVSLGRAAPAGLCRRLFFVGLGCGLLRFFSLRGTATAGLFQPQPPPAAFPPGPVQSLSRAGWEWEPPG